MYRVAQWVVRHKVLVVGVGAAGFIFFGGDKQEAQQPANPWAAGQSNKVMISSAPSSAKKSLTDKAIGAVSGAAKEYAGIDIGSVKESNTNNWSAATDATKKAAE